ncbi:permease prefix domain 1-containing protein [Deinococcus malanensis]|nr:permease prefix domain 1-containing protein [Deinococcus malanensis]
MPDSSPELRRYLARATRGLWGKRREEVYAELEEHVLERADHLMVFGVPQQEALSRALSELGPPGRLSAGMNQVYLMPKLIQMSALSALTAVLVSLSLSLLAEGNAQVAIANLPMPPSCAVSSKGMKSNAMTEIVSQKGNVYCYRFRNAKPMTYLDLNSLEQTLKPMGVTVSREGKQTLLKFPGATGTAQLKANTVRGNDRYARLEELPYHFSGTGLPVTLTGWTNPTVQVGETKFKLGTPGSSVPGSLIYQNVMLDIGRDLKITGKGVTLSARAWRDSSSARYFTHTVQVDAPEGTVVGIFSRDERGSALIDEAPVDGKGQVQLFSSREKLRYVTDPGKLTPYLSSGQGQALLVRLTGLIVAPSEKQNDKYTVIQPKTATSSGVR